MTSVAEVQALLRFLSQAKVPVPLAMSKVKDLKEASLTSPESLSKAPLPTIQSIFQDEKISKQVLSAAKRQSKKRTSSSITTSSPRAKRSKNAFPLPGTQLSPAAFEASLALPTLDLPSAALEQAINDTVIHTNRAPVVVAFVVQMLKYTMPSQPLSSRLSLAQAVISQGAQSKALNLGIKSGKLAEKEGWGEGQPMVRVMGQQLYVMRRWGYDCRDGGTHEEAMDGQSMKQEEASEAEGVSAKAVEARTSLGADEFESQETIKGDPTSPPPSSSPNPAIKQEQRQQPHTPETDIEPPLWALDLKKLRSTSNTSPFLSSPTTTTNTTGTNLPIYDPHSARNYLYKSFATAPGQTASDPSHENRTKKAAKAVKESEEKERNLALLLHALDHVYGSWIDAIGPEELNRRAWG
ncbi:MAG: hypothetical protein LQ352_005944, partial [Teloschistes flavicans]